MDTKKSVAETICETIVSVASIAAGTMLYLSFWRPGTVSKVIDAIADRKAPKSK